MNNKHERKDGLDELTVNEKVLAMVVLDDVQMLDDIIVYPTD